MSDTFTALHPSQVTVQAFVQFWRAFYRDDDSRYYGNISSAGRLTASNLVQLMAWKERRFTNRAQDYANAIPVTVLNRARTLPTVDDAALLRLVDEVVDHLQQAGLAKSNPIIWPIFLCHVARPDDIPIYDVNVWIAWGKISGWIKPHHYGRQPQTRSSYLEYRRWFNDLVGRHGLDTRDLDRALIEFGRFLLSPWGASFR